MRQRQVVIDTETTGVCVRRDIPWSIAFVDVVTGVHATFYVDWPNIETMFTDDVARGIFESSKADFLEYRRSLRQVRAEMIRWFDNDRITLVGHNVGFGWAMLQAVLTPDEMHRHVSHRLIDVHTLLWSAGYPTSSDEAFDRFIKDDRGYAPRHTALGDAQRTLSVFEELDA